LIQNNWRINNFFSSGKTLFSIFFKPLINFQEINIYWKKEKHEKIHYLFFSEAFLVHIYFLEK